jgi:late competence protein required for DNA uptake (superfamily II DNA/RNA helicase)
MSLGGYPPGAEHDRRAPWNQQDEKIECSHCKREAEYIQEILMCHQYYCRQCLLELYHHALPEYENKPYLEEFMEEENIKEL